MTTDKQLIDAANLLSAYVADRLPRQYTIVFEMSREECTMRLEDRFGEDLETQCDGDKSIIAELCDHARYLEEMD